LAPLQNQTWESFSVNWHADVKIAFHWITAVLQQPLARGSAVVALSSGAALQGSPLSGGYAGAKATIRFLAQYAAEEARRAKLDLRFTALLPRLTAATDLGRAAAEAYAQRSGRTVDELLAQWGAPLTPALVGAAVVRLLSDRALDEHSAFRLDSGGLTPLP
jgi:NADP-dependent 3-hydroxy acid dehydrogenase YdfG